MSRILLADDDLVGLDLRKQVLESAGHNVAVACTPSQTLLYLELGADLIIMDLRFLNAAGEPDTREGMELIRGIREQGFAGAVIVLSGWPEELYMQPEEKMVSRIMVKPVPTRELLEAIEALAALP